MEAYPYDSISNDHGRYSLISLDKLHLWINGGRLFIRFHGSEIVLVRELCGSFNEMCEKRKAEGDLLKHSQMYPGVELNGHLYIIFLDQLCELTPTSVIPIATIPDLDPELNFFALCKHDKKLYTTNRAQVFEFEQVSRLLTQKQSNKGTIYGDSKHLIFRSGNDLKIQSATVTKTLCEVRDFYTICCEGGLFCFEHGDNQEIVELFDLTDGAHRSTFVKTEHLGVSQEGWQEQYCKMWAHDVKGQRCFSEQYLTLLLGEDYLKQFRMRQEIWYQENLACSLEFEKVLLKEVEALEGAKELLPKILGEEQ